MLTLPPVCSTVLAVSDISVNQPWLTNLRSIGKVLPATQEFCDEVANGGGSSGGSSSAEPTAEPTETAAPTETAEPTASATESGSGSGYQTTAAPTTTAGGYPTSGSNSTAPQPTSSAVIAGAAQVGSMGGLAMLFLGAAAAL